MSTHDKALLRLREMLETTKRERDMWKADQARLFDYSGKLEERLVQTERERDEQQEFAMNFQRELDAWKEIERLSGRTRQAIYGMVYQLKAGKYGDKILEIPSCSMTPESVKIHDDICDALESRAYNEHDVCTASVGIWATLGVCEKLWRDKIDVYKKAKDENDERFMIERDTLKSELDNKRGAMTLELKRVRDENDRLRSALTTLCEHFQPDVVCIKEVVLHIARKALEEK